MKVENPEQLIGIVAGRLRTHGLPESYVGAVSEQLHDEFASEGTPGSFQAVFNLFGSGGLIVEDDDLDLMDEAFSFAFGASGLAIGLLTPPTMIASTLLGIATLGFNTYRAVKKLRRKGVRLSPDELAVATALRTIDGPATVDDIQRVINDSGRKADVAVALRTLSTARSADGTIHAFADQLGDGRWIAVGY
jgi:hypothetical protein